MHHICKCEWQASDAGTGLDNIPANLIGHNHRARLQALSPEQVKKVQKALKPFFDEQESQGAQVDDIEQDAANQNICEICKMDYIATQSALQAGRTITYTSHKSQEAAAGRTGIKQLTITDTKLAKGIEVYMGMQAKSLSKLLEAAISNCEEISQAFLDAGDPVHASAHA